jgi:hypothetical protein
VIFLSDQTSNPLPLTLARDAKMGLDRIWDVCDAVVLDNSDMVNKLDH